MPDPTRTAIGTWSGGRFMHFGEPLDDERLIALLRPDERLRTVITVDTRSSGRSSAAMRSSSSGSPKCMKRPPLQLPIALRVGSGIRH